ncbi:hypothetical protein FSP39_025371, partial [Pinctada imbricata]
EGFSEEDLEKPKFSFPAVGSKVPYVLSADTEQPVIQVPATMNRYLRDYQREGIKFLYNNYRAGKGAILGDDMGLGKTVQVIGFMLAVLGKQGNRLDVLKHRPKFIREMSDSSKALSALDKYPTQPFLIIGPGSVLYNWLDELETWGYFNVGKYHGAEKTECLKDIKKNKYDVVLTTYETFRDNVEELISIYWLAVIADEVHRIKGVKAQTTVALRKLKTNYRYGLTGTALQNNMAEIWSLLDWVQPGCLGSLATFKEEYVIPIEHGQKNDSTKRELAEARKLKEKFSKLRNKMMLRRTKRLIADQLPVKDDNVVFCKLSELQVSVYEMILDQPGIRFVMLADEPCACGSDQLQKYCCTESPDGESMKALKFIFMHLLLKTANHVALLLPSTDSNQSEYSKRIILRGLLEVFYSDHSKVLVFSYSTKVLDIIEQYMMTTGYEYRRLDGSTSMKQRMVLVREFNSDPNIFVFLISTKAGGLGLNLTGANRVIVFDPSWNPTNDLQAQDRAYRLGQRRDVHVYRLLSSGTIEENMYLRQIYKQVGDCNMCKENMYLRQIYKQQLDSVVVSSENARRYFSGIAGNKHQQGELFGIKNMLQFRDSDNCLTMDILKRNEKLEAKLSKFDITNYIPPPTDDKTSESEEDPGTDGLDTSTDSSSKEDMGKFYEELFDLTDTSPVKEVNIEEYDSPDGMGEPATAVKKSTSGTDGTTKRKLGSDVKGESTSDSEPVPGPSKRPDTKCSWSVRKRMKERKGSHGKVDEGFTSVKSVFEKCGVVHMHKNRQVVGGSKAEDHMSRCAVQEVYELHQNTQEPATRCEPMSESSDDEEPIVQGRRKKTLSKEDPNYPRTETIGNYRVLIGQTPKAIRRKHFEAISEYERSDTQIEFAERVLRCTPSGRRSILEAFYTSKHPDFKKLYENKDKIQDEVTEPPPKSVKKGPAKLIKNQRYRKSERSKRLNETLGVTFDDLSDSESQGSVKSRKGITRLSSKEESLEVGLKQKSTRGRTKPSTNRVCETARKPKKSKEEPIYLPSCDVSKTEDLDVSDFGGEEFERPRENPRGRRKIVHTAVISSDQLLDEIGKQSSENESEMDIDENCVKQRLIDNEVKTDGGMKNTDVNISVLDDIFGTSSGKRTMRRPPPGSRKKKRADTGYGSGDLFSDSSTAVSSQDEGVSDKSDLLANESTLKNDMMDCFTDPPTCKKKAKGRAGKIVSKLLSESEDEYNRLFESGKMKKREKPVVIVSIDSDVMQRSDRTPSLF